MAQSIDASRTRTLDKPPDELLSVAKGSEPSHKKFTQTIKTYLPSFAKSAACAPSLAVERQLVAARWRGAYGISGNRGVSKLTSSARAWPRTRSRRSAGVPLASGLRSISDQWLGPAPAVVVPARAHAMRLKSIKKRIILACLLGRDFLFGHLEFLVADAVSRSDSVGRWRTL